MITFEEIRDADVEYQRLKKQLELEKTKREITFSKQDRNARKGKPVPVLAPGNKQFQNTSKQRQELKKGEKKIQQDIELKYQKALQRRVEELAKGNPKEYEEYEKRMAKERRLKEDLEKMKENQREIERDR